MCHHDWCKELLVLEQFLVVALSSVQLNLKGWSLFCTWIRVEIYLYRSGYLPENTFTHMLVLPVQLQGSANVGIPIINHPPAITIDSWYKPFPKGWLIIVIPTLPVMCNKHYEHLKGGTVESSSCWNGVMIPRLFPRPVRIKLLKNPGAFTCWQWMSGPSPWYPLTNMFNHMVLGQTL